MSGIFESGPVKIFHFNKESGEFDEIGDESIPEGGIKEILANNPKDSYALFLMEKYIVWLYHGVDTSTKVKFMSAREITRKRDDILLGGKIITVDEGSEPLPFKFVTKMADPADYDLDTEASEEYKPAYAGTIEDVSMLEKISLEKIALLLEQVQTPNGFEREAIIHDNELYAVKNIRRTYMGSEVEDIELIPRPKDTEIESGTYMGTELTPRMLFENNRLVLVELLRKTEKRKKQENMFDNFQQQA